MMTPKRRAEWKAAIERLLTRGTREELEAVLEAIRVGRERARLVREVTSEVLLAAGLVKAEQAGWEAFARSLKRQARGW